MVTGGISETTNYLIVADKLQDGRKREEGNKFKDATKQGTKIITENDLNDWLIDKIGVGINEIFPDSNQSKLYKKSGSKKIRLIGFQINICHNLYLIQLIINLVQLNSMIGFLNSNIQILLKNKKKLPQKWEDINLMAILHPKHVQQVVLQESERILWFDQQLKP